MTDVGFTIEDDSQKQLTQHITQYPLSNEELGLRYERQIGYLLEKDGYHVKFNGALMKFDDAGRDLIASKGGHTLIIQTKRWSQSIRIHEKYIHQLYGTTSLYIQENPDRKNVRAVFYSNSEFTDGAREAAKKLGIELNVVKASKYPLIKCNINKSGERIFHLPMDEFYDRVTIRPKDQECYVETVAEAKAKGFRRAKKKSNRVS